MRFHVSLGSAKETSEAYRKHVLRLVDREYEAEESRRRAVQNQKEISSPPVQIGKIPTELGEPPMYKLISANIPEPERNRSQKPSQQEQQEYSCWPHVASNPACSSSRGEEEEEYTFTRSVPVYASTSFGNSVVGKVNVPVTRRVPVQFPFRNESAAVSRGMNIRMIPPELENATDDEVAAFLQKKRQEVEKERTKHARTMNVSQGAQFLADHLKPAPASALQNLQHATGLAPESLLKHSKRKRKAFEVAESGAKEPSSTKEEKEEQVAGEPADPEPSGPAKKQKTTSTRGRRIKRAPASKEVRKSEELPPVADDLDSF